MRKKSRVVRRRKSAPKLTNARRKAPRVSKKKAAPRRSMRRNRNPDDTFIGSAPTLWVSGVGRMQYPRGVLRSGPDSRSVRLFLGGNPAPRLGAKVTRIDYNDPVKAVEVYKTIAPFRHDCKDPFVVGPSSGGVVALISKSTAWEKQ